MRKLRWYHLALVVWGVLVVLAIVTTPNYIALTISEYGFEYFVGSVFGELLLILGVFWVLSKIYGAIVWVLSKIYRAIVGKRKGEQK